MCSPRLSGKLMSSKVGCTWTNLDVNADGYGKEIFGCDTLLVYFDIRLSDYGPFSSLRVIARSDVVSQGPLELLSRSLQTNYSTTTGSDFWPRHKIWTKLVKIWS